MQLGIIGDPGRSPAYQQPGNAQTGKAGEDAQRFGEPCCVGCQGGSHEAQQGQQVDKQRAAYQQLFTDADHHGVTNIQMSLQNPT